MSYGGYQGGGGYPPQGGGNPQGGGYPPQQGGYPPPGGYPPQQYGGGGYGGGGYGSPLQYAENGKRILAHIIDGLLVGLGALPGYILIIIGAAASGGRDDAVAAVAILGGLLVFVGIFGLLAYNAYLLGKTGSSLGKRWMKVKVLDQQGQPIGFGKALLREFIKLVLGNVCFILLLWPLWDQERQGLQDKMLNTHVYSA
jgi:uncharacterized RDD family membrane protein YckC